MTHDRLKWYSGISKDQKRLNDYEIVLHADENVCRVLSCEDGMYIVSEYPSAMLSSAQVAFSNKTRATFRFNDTAYLDATRYVRAKVEHVDNIERIYKNFCESCDCHELKNFLDSLAYSRATNSSGKLYRLSPECDQLNVIIGVVRDNVPITHLSLTMRLREISDPKFRYEAESLDRHEICNLIYSKLNEYGDPPLRSEVVQFVQNYLEMLALSLKTDGIRIPEVK